VIDAYFLMLTYINLLTNYALIFMSIDV